jgi:hypothetical protein
MDQDPCKSDPSTDFSSDSMSHLKTNNVKNPKKVYGTFLQFYGNWLQESKINASQSGLNPEHCRHLITT